MSEVKILTKEIAEQFIADEESVNLSQYTSLDEEAAVVLSKSEVFVLNLCGLTVLTEVSASNLAKFKGNLNLSGLTSMSDAIAQIFSKASGHLNLDGVASLSENAISAFVDHYFPSIKGWSGMNDKLAEFILSSEGITFQGSLSLNSKKLLIPYLPERFIICMGYYWHESGFHFEGYEVIERESYKELLDKLEFDGSVNVLPNLPDHIERKIEFSELIDAFSIYKTSEDAVVAFEETLGFSSVGHSFSDDILSYDA